VEAAGIALATLFGLIFGSFANVVVHRVPLKESIVHPASRCPSCGVALRARDNIPVVSWLVLHGRCRNCNARISVRYPAIELLTGILFGLAAWRIRPATDLIAYLPLLWVLVVLSFIDLEHKLLPNRIVIPSLVTGVVLLGISAALEPGIHAWGRALAGGAISFIIFLALAIISPRGMGMGDVKLSAVLGLALAYQGWGRLFLGFLLAFVTGAVVGLAMIATRRAGRKSEIPFGPYLALGAAVALLFGRPLVHAWLPGFDPRYLR
jgi:leader peptidase (prepilin peptidase) / N-methyltransferase